MTKLDELIQVIHKKHCYVQMHNYPDQDALASAFGLQTLLKIRGIDAVITYHGIIDKYNTKLMIDHLKIPVFPVEQLTFSDSDEIIIVDGQKGNINVNNITGTEIACIDHHPLLQSDCYRFFDIRSEIGACSSIIASYFFENHIPIPTQVATALLFGIKIDTANLTRQVSDLDLKMFCHLHAIADSQLLHSFEMNNIKRSDLSSYENAMRSLRYYGNMAVTNIGNDCSEAIMGTVNDFLLTISEVDFTLIYSYRDNGLKFSVRSANPDYDASRIIRAALKDLGGDGGGHSDMAAGFIPHINDQETADTIAHLVEQNVKKEVLGD